MPDWLTLENARVFAGLFATVIASGVAAYFARAQMRVAKSQRNIARDKLKFDLFEKRYEIYKYVMDAALHFAYISENDKLDTTIMRNFLHATSEAEFFFDDAIVSHIKELMVELENIIRMYRDHAKLRDRVDDAVDNFAKKRLDLEASIITTRERVMKMAKSTPEYFIPALQFQQLTNPD